MKRILLILALCLILTACDDTLHYPERDNEDKQIEFTYEASDDQWLENQTNHAMMSGLVGNGDFLYFSLGSTPARYNTNSGEILKLSEAAIYRLDYTTEKPAENRNSLFRVPVKDGKAERLIFRDAFVNRVFAVPMTRKDRSGEVP